jgi:hypothetical protein
MAGPLDRYTDQVISDQDRILFREAANAAGADAPRAAYVMVWISCAESLKRKFRELAPRDAQATKVDGEIARKEAAQQSIDKYVLDVAKDYGFVTDAEFLRLQHVYSMRCLFGHPYEMQPTQEALLAAAADVVEIVLARPTKLRHGYLSEQVRLLSKEHTFLDDLLAAVEAYAVEVHGKAADELHLWFTQKLWKETEAIARDPSMAVFFRRGVWFSIRYLQISLPAILTGWNVIGDLTSYPITLSQILAHPGVFPHVAPHAQDIVVGNVLANAQFHAAHLRSLEALHSAGVLNERQIERFREGVRRLSPSSLAVVGLHPSYYSSMLIDALKSYDWYQQAPAIEVLQNLGPNGIGLLGAEVQHVLGNNVLQAAEGRSRASEGLVSQIAASPSRWPLPFLDGILTETFVNEREQVRFKLRCFSEVLRIVSNLPAASLAPLIQQVADRIVAGSLKHPWTGSHDRNAVVATLRDPAKVAPASADTLAPLATALEQLGFQDDADAE